MNRRLSALALSLLLPAALAAAEDMKELTLPAPRMEGGKPVMQALKERQSRRSYSPKKLEPQVLADLLWAAVGVNRPATGMRTSPTAMNWREIEVYAVLEEGAYLYDPEAKTLKAVASGDLRKVAGQQEFVATVPVNLVFVADYNRMKGAKDEDREMYAAADAAYASANVYLFCASADLATVVRGLVDRKALAEALKLPENKKVVFAQSVGYPAEGK